MSAKLYLDDAYTHTFDAQVVRCQQRKENYEVVLDRTAFYPGGGGQPADVGTLSGLPIIGVIEEEGDIIHILSKPLSGRVTGVINWDVRHDYMQQHTGQHILSQAFERVANAPTVGWKLSLDQLSVDVEVAEVTAEIVTGVEALVNNLILDNLSVETFTINTIDELKSIALRKPPKDRYLKDGVRIVNVGNFDIIPCGGTHVRQTGEISMIVITHWHRNGDAWQVHFACGKRALAEYRRKRDDINSLSAAFKSPSTEVARHTLELLNERDQLRISLSSAEDRIAELLAQNLINKSVQVTEAGPRLATAILNIDESSKLKNIVLKAKTHPGTIFVLGSNGTKPSLIIARADELDHPNANALIKQICQEFGGRGGGSEQLAQAGGFKADDMPAIITRTQELITSNNSR